jgi:hypothetical protein
LTRCKPLKLQGLQSCLASRGLRLVNEHLCDGLEQVALGQHSRQRWPGAIAPDQSRAAVNLGPVDCVTAGSGHLHWLDQNGLRSRLCRHRRQSHHRLVGRAGRRLQACPEKTVFRFAAQQPPIFIFVKFIKWGTACQAVRPLFGASQ